MTTNSPQRSGPRRWRGFAIGLVVGLIAALAVILPAIQTSREGGGRPPRLTRAAYDEANRLWDENGPANYELDIEVSGNRPGKIHVEVRDRQAVLMLRDGVEPRQRRTWYYWTVPGMLDTIGQELDKVDNPEKGFGAPAGSEVILRAKFYGKLGLPSRYSRVVSGQNLDMGWTVTRFTSDEIVGPAADQDDDKKTDGKTEDEKTKDEKSGQPRE